MSTKLPNGVHELLVNRIDSFEKLEIVVALHRAPHATISLDDLSRHVKLSHGVVRHAVLELSAAAIVDVNSRSEVQLLPPTQAEQAAIAEMVRLYEVDRFSLVKALAEIAIDRIRNMASRAFADAFVIRRKPQDDDGKD